MTLNETKLTPREKEMVRTFMADYELPFIAVVTWALQWFLLEMGYQPWEEVDE